MEATIYETDTQRRSLIPKVLSIVSLVLASVGAILLTIAVVHYLWMEALYEEYFVVRVYIQIPVIGYVSTSVVGMSIACAMLLVGGVAFVFSRRLR